MRTALILSGGGANGAWQAGWLHGSVACGALAEVDVIVGTSTGGISAAFLAMLGRDRFPAAVERLVDLYRDTLTDDNGAIYRPSFRWLPEPLRTLIAAWRRPSIGDSTPLTEQLRAALDFTAINASGITVLVNGIDLRAGGRPKSTWWSTPALQLWHVLATSAFPAAFAPVDEAGGYWTDGGLVDMAGVEQATALGCDRVIAVITRNPSATAPAPSLGPRSSLLLDLLPRMLHLQLMHMLENDVARAAELNEWIDRGWLAHPSIRRIDLHTCYPRDRLGDSLDFRLSKAEAQIQQGHADALAYWATHGHPLEAP